MCLFICLSDTKTWPHRMHGSDCLDGLEQRAMKVKMESQRVVSNEEMERRRGVSDGIVLAWTKRLDLRGS